MLSRVINLQYIRWAINQLTATRCWERIFGGNWEYNPWFAVSHRYTPKSVIRVRDYKLSVRTVEHAVLFYDTTLIIYGLLSWQIFENIHILQMSLITVYNKNYWSDQTRITDYNKPCIWFTKFYWLTSFIFDTFDFLFNVVML